MSEKFTTVTRRIKKKKIDINKYFIDRNINMKKAKASDFKFTTISKLLSMNQMSNEIYLRFSYFLVKYNYRQGFLTSKHEFIPDDQLRVIELNEGSLYIYNKNTRYQELIDNINNVTNPLLHDYLTILLGFPCRKPNMDIVRYGHSVSLVDSVSNQRCQIYAFMSNNKLNAQEVVYPFVQAVKHYNKIHNTNYEIQFNFHKFREL